METQARYIRVGIFVLTLLIGSLAAAIWVSNINFSHGQIFAIYFKESVSGLRENELVTYNGVPIGKVKNIDIDPQRLSAIRVLVQIDQPELIRQNSRASLEVKGISGTVFVRIHANNSDAPPLSLEKGQSYPIIPSEDSPLQQVMNDAPRILQNLANLSDKMALFFDEKNRKHFTNILENTDGFTNKIEGKTENALQEITQLTRTLREVSSNFNRILKKFEDNPRNFLLKTSREDGHVITP